MRNKPCMICLKPDEEKPMVFRGELWCSDEHRKMLQNEKALGEPEISMMADAGQLEHAYYDPDEDEYYFSSKGR